MIIWKGHGWLVVLFAGGFLLLMQTVGDGLFGEGFYQANAWPKIVALFVAAAATWFVGVKLNGGEDKELLDPETGQPVRLAAPSHTLFFVPMQYWAIALVAIAVVGSFAFGE